MWDLPSKVESMEIPMVVLITWKVESMEIPMVVLITWLGTCEAVTPEIMSGGNTAICRC